MKLRSKSVLGLVGLGLLMLAASQTDDDNPQPEPETGPGKPPGQVPMPAGWRRYTGTVSKAMSKLAYDTVHDPTSTFGDLVVGGAIAETGKSWGVLIEWHYHPPGEGFSAEGWHKGATLVVQS